MKILVALIAATFTLSVYANENYECEFIGPNYNLNIQEDGSITLSNKFKSYECKKGYVNLPGTEAILSKIFCISQSGSVSYFANENADGNIVLSKELLFSRDILCKRI